MSKVIIVNPEMERILDLVFSLTRHEDKESDSSQFLINFNSFRKTFQNIDPKGISWNQICVLAKSSRMQRFCFVLMVNLLEENVYCKEHSEALYNLLPQLTVLTQKSKLNWKQIFCEDDIEYFVICPNSKKKLTNLYFIVRLKNLSILSLWRAFLKSERKYSRYVFQEFCNHLEESLGSYIDRIQSHKDFSDETFWVQIQFYKSFFSNNQSEKIRAIQNICVFYRFLVNTYPEYDYFKTALKMTDNLLFSYRLVALIMDEYYFMAFNRFEKIEDHEKIVLILRGYDRFSTSFKSEDSILIDLSTLPSPMYRKEILNYIRESTSLVGFSECGTISYIRKGLIFLLNLKKQTGYPNPKQDYFTTQEAVFIRNFFNDESLSLNTRNSKIGSLRRFLQWEANIRMMTFEDMFFDYLTQYEEPTKTSGESISELDLISLNALLIRKSETDHVAKLHYSIFHLCIQTEFRISQICHLHIDCIKPSVKPNQFIITSNSKTSHGVKEEYVITNLTYRHLMYIINETQSLRENVARSSMRNYIFLYNRQMNTTDVISASKFSKYISDCCIELGLSKNYTASNLRDTHMTKSLEYKIRNDKSDAELAILTRHKHIDTTKNHYIDIELEKMLESTYGIIIGNSELLHAERNIVDKIPNSASSKSAIVENGCGNCTVNNCIQNSPFPCLACKDFVTTIAHEKFFIKAIETVDLRLTSAQTPHDKEDLNTIKLLYVLYLKAIYMHKEAKSNDRN